MDGQAAQKEDPIMCNCSCRRDNRIAPPTSTFDGSGALSPDPFMIPHNQRDAEYYKNWEDRNAGGTDRQRARNYGGRGGWGY